MIYVIGSYNDRRVKIGHSEEPTNRLKELQTGNPNELKIFALLRGRAAEEQRLHNFLKKYRTRGEWFDFGSKHPIDMILLAGPSAVEIDRVTWRDVATEDNNTSYLIGSRLDLSEEHRAYWSDIAVKHLLAKKRTKRARRRSAEKFARAAERSLYGLEGLAMERAEERLWRTVERTVGQEHLMEALRN